VKTVVFVFYVILFCYSRRSLTRCVFLCTFSIEPRLEVLIQPKQHGQRFRYKCESKSAGSLIGEGSTNEQKVYPTVEVCDTVDPLHNSFRVFDILLKLDNICSKK